MKRKTSLDTSEEPKNKNPRFIHSDCGNSAPSTSFTVPNFQENPSARSLENPKTNERQTSDVPIESSSKHGCGSRPFQIGGTHQQPESSGQEKLWDEQRYNDEKKVLWKKRKDLTEKENKEISSQIADINWLTKELEKKDVPIEPNSISSQIGEINWLMKELEKKNVPVEPNGKHGSVTRPLEIGWSNQQSESSGPEKLCGEQRYNNENKVLWKRRKDPTEQESKQISSKTCEMLVPSELLPCHPPLSTDDKIQLMKEFATLKPTGNTIVETGAAYKNKTRKEVSEGPKNKKTRFAHPDGENSTNIHSGGSSQECETNERQINSIVPVVQNNTHTFSARQFPICGTKKLETNADLDNPGLSTNLVFQKFPKPLQTADRGDEQPENINIQNTYVEHDNEASENLNKSEYLRNLHPKAFDGNIVSAIREENSGIHITETDVDEKQKVRCCGTLIEAQSFMQDQPNIQNERNVSGLKRLDEMSLSNNQMVEKFSKPLLMDYRGDGQLENIKSKEAYAAHQNDEKFSESKRKPENLYPKTNNGKIIPLVWKEEAHFAHSDCINSNDTCSGGSSQKCGTNECQINSIVPVEQNNIHPFSQGQFPTCGANKLQTNIDLDNSGSSTNLVFQKSPKPLQTADRGDKQPENINIQKTYVEHDIEASENLNGSEYLRNLHPKGYDGNPVLAIREENNGSCITKTDVEEKQKVGCCGSFLEAQSIIQAQPNAQNERNVSGQKHLDKINLSNNRTFEKFSKPLLMDYRGAGKSENIKLKEAYGEHKNDKKNSESKKKLENLHPKSNNGKIIPLVWNEEAKSCLTEADIARKRKAKFGEIPNGAQRKTQTYTQSIENLHPKINNEKTIPLVWYEEATNCFTEADIARKRKAKFGEIHKETQKSKAQSNTQARRNAYRKHHQSYNIEETTYQKNYNLNNQFCRRNNKNWKAPGNQGHNNHRPNLANLRPNYEIKPHKSSSWYNSPTNR
ncbi:hypothetical protein QYM36_018338 [Artemia franciscana]|uniref:Uncharacterized protein n=1 Tax=Artemia franciscana TaxID=6661 RepID=A0AA88KU36_ARTSF|nr:hypothetical protein QYM36_018338 [Artemia franciscana]